MGMFDTVFIDCPHCHKVTSEQSKAGPCELKDYPLEKAPKEIRKSLRKKPFLFCEHCGEKFKIVKRLVMKKTVRAVPLDEDEGCR